MSVSQDLYNLRTLRVYLYYRILLAVALFLMYEMGFTTRTMGLQLPELFRWASLAYAVLGLASLLLLLDNSSYRSPLRISLLLVVDAFSLLTLIHASGGLASGLGYLLAVTAAVASMFLRTQMSLAYAAFVTILLFLHSLLMPDFRDRLQELFSAGVLGLLIFITAIAFQYLSERVRASSREVEEKTVYARQLVKLAELIVTRMQTGIMVINEKLEIELINESAISLLDYPQGTTILGKRLSQISNLEEIVNKWLTIPIVGAAQVHSLENGTEIRINFASVEAENKKLTILYLEDYRNMIQQAQQLKLASLGRLTASIAHEIRNPLGAISHATQLLSESENLEKDDKRFTEIIIQHTQRVNAIVENVMSLSKRKEPRTQLIALNVWLPEFIDEYLTSNTGKIHYKNLSDRSDIKVDPSHLRQVLTNLFDNGLRYNMAATGEREIDVVSGLSQNDDTSYIRVLDQGPGVPENKIDHIFEPFFTTGSQGTGLGLYISRELCEINQARLDYFRTDDNRTCFEIDFPHHLRMI